MGTSRRLLTSPWIQDEVLRRLRERGDEPICGVHAQMVEYDLQTQRGVLFDGFVSCATFVTDGALAAIGRPRDENDSGEDFRVVYQPSEFVGQAVVLNKALVLPRVDVEPFRVEILVLEMEIWGGNFERRLGNGGGDINELGEVRALLARFHAEALAADPTSGLDGADEREADPEDVFGKNKLIKEKLPRKGLMKGSLEGFGDGWEVAHAAWDKGVEPLKNGGVAMDDEDEDDLDGDTPSQAPPLTLEDIRDEPTEDDQPESPQQSRSTQRAENRADNAEEEGSVQFSLVGKDKDVAMGAEFETQHLDMSLLRKSGNNLGEARGESEGLKSSRINGEFGVIRSPRENKTQAPRFNETQVSAVGGSGGATLPVMEDDGGCTTKASDEPSERLSQGGVETVSPVKIAAEEKSTVERGFEGDGKLWNEVAQRGNFESRLGPVNFEKESSTRDFRDPDGGRAGEQQVKHHRSGTEDEKSSVGELPKTAQQKVGQKEVEDRPVQAGSRHGAAAPKTTNAATTADKPGNAREGEPDVDEHHHESEPAISLAQNTPPPTSETVPAHRTPNEEVTPSETIKAPEPSEADGHGPSVSNGRHAAAPRHVRPGIAAADAVDKENGGQEIAPGNVKRSSTKVRKMLSYMHKMKRLHKTKPWAAIFSVGKVLRKRRREAEPVAESDPEDGNAEPKSKRRVSRRKSSASTRKGVYA